MESDKEFIDTYFGGNTEKYNTAIKDGHRYALSWDDIAAYGTVLPKHDEQAQQLIEKFLGYLPNQAIYIPHEVYIRAAIEQFSAGQITQAQFDNEVCQHVMDIRNDDMKKDGWLKTLVFDESDFNRYQTELGQFKDAAKERLRRFLGYVPALNHSLEAEIFLRQLCSWNDFDPEWPMTAHDCKALTITVYREALLTHGKNAANKLPMAGKLR